MSDYTDKKAANTIVVEPVYLVETRIENGVTTYWKHQDGLTVIENGNPQTFSEADLLREKESLEPAVRRLESVNDMLAEISSKQTPWQTDSEGATL